MTLNSKEANNQAFSCRPEIPWDPVLPNKHQYLNIGQDLVMEYSQEYRDR
jgi:hypothetical protein